jgi:hypothetical protein
MPAKKTTFETIQRIAPELRRAHKNRGATIHYYALALEEAVWVSADWSLSCARMLTLPPSITLAGFLFWAFRKMSGG